MRGERMDKVICKLDMSFGRDRGMGLGEGLGVRGWESVKVKGSDMELNKGVVRVEGKGGRFREVGMGEEGKEVVDEVKEEFGE